MQIHIDIRVPEQYLHYFGESLTGCFRKSGFSELEKISSTTPSAEVLHVQGNTDRINTYLPIDSPYLAD